MKIRLAAPLQIDSIIDGEGLRMVLWFQGCEIHCPKCHNPQTWDINGGQEYELEDILKQIYDYKDRYDGITLSGGHPLLQPNQCLEIVQFCKQNGLNVWLYTGLIYEDIIKNKIFKEILKYVDVLVDGRYIDSLRDITLKWKGSSNQRVIDVQKSLQEGGIVLYE